MEQFGKYQLVRRIGSGGMAEVFLARTSVAQGLEKQLVIKKIHPANARSRHFVSMFVDEAKIALGLNHPNIVQVFDFGTVGDTFFLAMEQVEGMDVLRLLQASLERERDVPLGLAAYIVQQACKGLDYAHRKTDEFGEPLGIVHRDVSPQNVLVSWDGAVKIVDFGIASAKGIQEDDGVIKGKFSYMSPEQARGEPVDRRSDVFSAGVVLFELCCMQPLFRGRGAQARRQVQEGAIPAPRSVNAQIPRALEDIILKALAYFPDDRYQTARDLQSALGRFQLQQAHSEGDLIDSSSLAQFLADIVPKRSRRAATLPPVRSDTGRRRPMTTPPAGMPAVDFAGERFTTGPASMTPAPEPAKEVRERKFVFVIEGHICGLPALRRTLGPSRVAEITGDFFRVATDIAYKHDAHVHEALAGDGFTFVVGMPVAGEDDPSRTIRLALALVDLLDGIGHDVSPELRLAVGVQRGAVILRRSGASFRYELSGTTTAIAKKLARAAHGGEVLVSARVFRVARGDWQFEPLSTIDVPAEPDTHPEVQAPDSEPGVQRSRVYRLIGPKERADRLRERSAAVGELIGRDLELKAMRDAYRDVLVSRKKRPILITGDAGVGKGALVNAFLEGIPEREAVILRAASRVSTAYTPYAIIADLARDLLGLAEGAEPAEIERRLERMVPLLYPPPSDPREVRGTMDAVGRLLGVQVSRRSRDADRSASKPVADAADGDEGTIDAAERRQRILQAMLRFEQQMSPDRPIVIVGEDAHWCDDESLDLFRELLQIPTPRPILGVVTSRPDARLAKLASELNPDLIRLEELDAKNATSLVVRRFVPDQDVSELAAQIVARAGGNPFFIREMIDSLIDRGIVAVEPDDGEHPGMLRWIAQGAPIQVPTSVEALLATRLDRLPQPEKEAALHAAVLGRSSRPEAVAALLGRPAEDDLEALVRRGLLDRRDGRFVFKNDMTMTVAYGLLTDDDRTRLHRIAAERIAGSPAYRAGQDDAVIARHYELAGDASTAADRYLAAAAHAVEVGGNADAFRQLTRALKLLPAGDHERRFAARREREQILGRLARRPQQLREIQNLTREAQALGDPAKLALAHARQAEFYIRVGKAQAATRAIGPAMEHARASGDPLAEAEVTRLRAWIARLTGHFDDSLALCEQALALCDETPAGLRQRAEVLHVRGGSRWNLGQLEQAIEAFAETLVIYRMLDLPRDEARALNNMGIAFAAMGEFEEALAHYKSSLKLAQKLGDRASIGSKLGNIGQTYVDIGDLDRAKRYLDKALQLAEQGGDQGAKIDAMITLGQVYIQRGDLPRAIARFEKSREWARERADRYQEIRAQIYLALARVEEDQDPEGALALAREATEMAEPMSMLIGRIFGRAVQGLALAALGYLDEAADATEEAAALQRKTQQPEGAEELFAIHAQVSEQSGRLDQAREALRDAHKEIERKASRLRDPDLRATYLASRVSRAVAEARARLCDDEAAEVTPDPA